MHHTDSSVSSSHVPVVCFHWHFWAKNGSNCNKLSVKSVHCSCPPAIPRAFRWFASLTREQIGCKYGLASVGTSGLAALLSPHHQAGRSASAAHMAQGLSINTLVRRPFRPHDQSRASSCSEVSPPVSTSLWLWLPPLLCLFGENDFHYAAPSERVARQIWRCFSCGCAVFVESLQWCLLCNFMQRGCRVVILVLVEHLRMLLSHLCMF